MEENRKGEVGLKVIANGIEQAIRHHILATQIELSCDKKDALRDTIVTVNSIIDSLHKEF